LDWTNSTNLYWEVKIFLRAERIERCREENVIEKNVIERKKMHLSLGTLPGSNISNAVGRKTL